MFSPSDDTGAFYLDNYLDNHNSPVEQKCTKPTRLVNNESPMQHKLIHKPLHNELNIMPSLSMECPFKNLLNDPMMVVIFILIVAVVFLYIKVEKMAKMMRLSSLHKSFFYN